MTKKPSRKRPTKSRMREIVLDYASLFDGWKPNKDGLGFYRTADDIIIQKMWFESLRSGDYRPVSVVAVMGNPRDLGLNFQFLDMRHREISSRWHEDHIQKTSAAILAQFKPSISSDLTPQCAWSAIDYEGVSGHVNYILGVASLAAYLQKTDEAVKWISKGLDRIHLMKAKRDLEPAEKDVFNKFDALKTAFNDGSAEVWVRHQAKLYASWP